MSVLQKIIFSVWIIASFIFLAVAEEKIVVFFVFTILTSFMLLVVHVRKRRRIYDIPLYGLYRRQDGRLFFKITDKLHLYLKALGLGDPLVSGDHQELYRAGSSEEFNPDEIVTLKKRFKNTLHPDLHFDRDYSLC
jgi:hypothetical protein